MSSLPAGFSLVAETGGYSLVGVLGLLVLLLQSVGSRCVGFSSCGAQSYLPHSMWDFLGPGVVPGSCALVGGFLTTDGGGGLIAKSLTAGSPGKPPGHIYLTFA